ncbi:MAG TPA: HAMP domain-containing protein, partial [Thermoanaerobaculia bacterium]|nr:HAMP domain-containing protein [Thermoanaerobaculia bacterium]
MSLRTRIGLALVGIAAILLAPAIYGLLNLRELERISRELQTRNATAILALGRLTTAVEEVDNAQRIYLAFGGQPAEVRAPSATAVGVARRKGDEALAQLGTAGFDVEIEETVRGWERIGGLLGEQQARVERGDLAAADQLTESELAPALADFSRSLEDLAARIDRHGERRAARATAIAAEAVRTTVVAMLVALLAAVLVGGLLARNLLRPLAALTGATRRVARGDFQVDLAPTSVR